MLNTFLHIEESHSFFNEVILHSAEELLRLLPFLFLTYLLMEFIEHRGKEKTELVMRRAGAAGPLIGGLLGALPQCAFSAAAASLYSGRVITLGTLIAVFLSTSDEMLPILIAGELPPRSILLIVVYKTVSGIILGFTIDLVRRLTHRAHTHSHIGEMCEEGGCHCERGIFRSALHHTLTVSLFVLAVALLTNSAMFFVGEEMLAKILPRIPVISHLIAALIGLLPSCAPSVLLSKLMLSGIISEGAMLSGLFSGAGVGILVLLRTNRSRRENVFILSLLVLLGTLLGGLFDIILPAFSL